MNKKSALMTVFLVVLVDLMGFGIVLPLLPFYASNFNATALSIGLLYSVYSLGQLVFSPIWGSLSDRIGRRPIMLLSTFGAALSYVLFALSGSFTVLFLSRLIGGIMGGNISTAQAYVADVTTHEDRAKGMGLIGAAFGIGFMAGPAIATLLIHPSFHQAVENAGLGTLAGLLSDNKYAVPGFFAAALSAISFLLVFFKLPETVHSEKIEDDTRIIKAGIFTSRFWKTLAGDGRVSTTHILPLLFLSVFLLSFGQSSLYSAFPLFCKSRLHFTPEKVGLQFAYMGLIAVLIQGGLMKHLVKRFGEKKLFLIGNVLMAVGLGLIPFASNATWLLLFLGIMSIGGSLNGPTLNSLVSKSSDPKKVGAIMGVSQGLSSLGRVVGPTWGGLLFGISFQAPFIATSLLLLLAVWVGARAQRI